MVKPIVLITMGDPAGSGPELVLKALLNPDIYEIGRYVIVGDLRVLMRARDIVKARDLNLMVIDDPSSFSVDTRFHVGVIDLGNVDVGKLTYGRPSALGGEASYQYVVKAVELVKGGRGDALVTAPISKESLNLAGHRYPGHTELLADLTGVSEVRMMLVARHLKVTHVTTHVSLRKALELISRDSVYRTIVITYEALRGLFGIVDPKIAVAGLNPHAGEGGLFGNEELYEVGPAVELARNAGIKASGPYPPDTVFYRAYYWREFDAVIAMYHDQGHIPVKMVGLMEGVNLTLGLPFIRTSPDHGTVWDKAGTGLADERATLEAIRLAAELVIRKVR